MLPTDGQGDNQDKPYCKDMVEDAHYRITEHANRSQ